MESSKIWLSSPHMGGEEIKFVHEAFDTNWISPVGPHLKAFEDELAIYNKIAHCAVLASGTAGIHLALILLGISTGDEVICSSFTFSASCNPIVYQKATPVFVDSEAETWNMDPDLLKNAIEDRHRKTGKLPKAIILVHLYGMPAHLDSILSVANAYGIPLIEDAAESLGTTYKGKKTGTFGELGIYSFNGNKIITTSGGGALVSSNSDHIASARFLSTQARDEAPHYQHSKIGYNYRMSNICAGIGRGQLQVLDEWIHRRRANYAYYRSNLEMLNGISFISEPPGFFSNRWLTTILIDPDKTQGKDRDTLRLAMENENIESRPLWKPMHLQPVFEKYPAYVSGVSEELFKKGLCIPSGSNLTSNDKERVVSVFKKVLC